ncbi:MAG TPA: GDSL-type esterase/lipase family protein [Ilumatobacteraceae bacterium]|nr:GDSL-type esterase/lipase family protein [Ilumatobacteraceae bacterium]
MRKLPGPRRFAALASLVVVCAVAAPLAARADIASIGQAGARATEQAVRINRLCTRVWVIGDSLTVGSAAALRSGLDSLKLEAEIVDGANNRRISATAPISGVRAARSIRATSGEANCWVIALGTNDISNGVITTTRARAAVAEMLAEVTPQARVWWVNVDFRSLDQSTRTFNTVLNERAAADLRFAVIDWYALAESHPEWFVDVVHVNSAGYTARAALIVDSLRRSSGK